MKKDEAIIILGTKAKVNFVPWLMVWNYAHTNVGSYKKRCLGHIVLRSQCFSLVVEIMKRRQVLWYETTWWHHTEKEDKLKKTHPQKNNSGSNSHFICMPTFVQSWPSWNIINSEALGIQESHKIERKTIRDRIIGSSQHPGLPLWVRSLLKPAFRSWLMTWLIVASRGTHSWCLSLQYHTSDVDGNLSLQLLPAFETFQKLTRFSCCSFPNPTFYRLSQQATHGWHSKALRELPSTIPLLRAWTSLNYNYNSTITENSNLL